MLRESRDAYHRASQLLGNDTYPLVNEARVNFLLSAVEPGTRQAVLSRLRNLEYLARFQAYPGPPARRDPWKRPKRAPGQRPGGSACRAIRLPGACLRRGGHVSGQARHEAGPA
jgi:hypothetical protein